MFFFRRNQTEPPVPANYHLLAGLPTLPGGWSSETGASRRLQGVRWNASGLTGRLNHGQSRISQNQRNCHRTSDWDLNSCIFGSLGRIPASRGSANRDNRTVFCLIVNRCCVYDHMGDVPFSEAINQKVTTCLILLCYRISYVINIINYICNTANIVVLALANLRPPLV